MSQDELIIKAWLDAAKDLDIEVIAPFVLNARSGHLFNFIALVKKFGSSKGALVTTNDHEAGSPDAAEEQGYYWSALYPESYLSYNRKEVMEMLNDWGWFGEEEEKPSWYTGKSWS